MRHATGTRISSCWDRTGYGRLQRMVLGSVAGAVVASAPCSVGVRFCAKHLLHEDETAA